MTTQRCSVILTAINLALLLTLAAQAGPTHAQGAGQTVAPVLRGHALELVDRNGQVRSRINIEESGEVVFRLVDEKGTIRVKLGASSTGSGLLLLDEATEPGVHMIAGRAPAPGRPTNTRITLRDGSGRQRVLKP